MSRDDSRSRRPGEKEEWESLGVGQACRISQFRPLDSQPFGETDANVAQSLSRAMQVARTVAKRLSVQVRVRSAGCFAPPKFGQSAPDPLG